MRAFIVAAVALFAAVMPGFAAPAPARMSPADIQKSFFSGQPFTAATPAGLAYKMTFTADGRRTP